MAKVEGCIAVSMLCYTIALWAFIVGIGSIAIRDFKDYDTFSKMGGDQLSGVYDLGRDWQRAPFTDLYVTEEFSCQEGWEPVYERIFYGLKEGCDCLGITDRWISTDNIFTFGEGGCNHNQTRAGCRTASPFPPVRMNRMNERIICGKAGLPFVNATRPEEIADGTTGTYRCPEASLPCGANHGELTD